ncbi:hypothetical protein V6N13_113865 [Hibiscus sabdariffa]|uniref:RRM domain-containing protein n=1 Tax=Hibiscus sabdariffa TaxID=183260 RepID=A0ABR2U0F0_9ROSI
MSTFAFVRIANFEGSSWAIRLGNNRIMDGYHIKVYLEKTKENLCHTKENLHHRVVPVCNPVEKGKTMGALRDNRSFKGVLIGSLSQVEELEAQTKDSVTGSS